MPDVILIKLLSLIILVEHPFMLFKIPDVLVFRPISYRHVFKIILGCLRLFLMVFRRDLSVFAVLYRGKGGITAW